MTQARRFWTIGALALVILAGGGLWMLRTWEAAPGDQPGAEERQAKLSKQLEALRPRGVHVLIDTGANRLYLMKNDELIMEAVCSTGSGRRLNAGGRTWTFATPRGVFAIRGKTPNPVWRRPDWSFLEEGKPVPERESERFERGVLGEYALDIGDGYFIHGTLYERLLGENITHGCIRLGSKDLVRLARTAPVGTRVYIY